MTYHLLILTFISRFMHTFRFVQFWIISKYYQLIVRQCCSAHVHKMLHSAHTMFLNKSIICMERLRKFWIGEIFYVSFTKIIQLLASVFIRLQTLRSSGKLTRLAAQGDIPINNATLGCSHILVLLASFSQFSAIFIQNRMALEQ